MATKARKPAPAKGKATRSKAIESKTGAGPAVAARSKDAAKPSFGKAAPKKVVPTATKATAKPAKPRKPATGGRSMAGSAMRTVKATANVAAGAVVATARGAASLAASVMGKGGPKTGVKAK
ncbi:hypothetical protein [Mesorhizobium sp.]|uniref:hypothetical protein n=1 Tax=Mesorhizobium sp. TaxID=1871066 RepID=UPI0011FE57FD|nr:hypothetical protein [Mesorhizobium sp.]TIO34841.1 MAG: hypothetical protein E5X89_09870 [Mesorhizobium sp.]